MVVGGVGVVVVVGVEEVGCGFWMFGGKCLGFLWYMMVVYFFVFLEEVVVVMSGNGDFGVVNLKV